MSTDFLRHMREFNTKERYHLLRFAIGSAEWQLSPEFRGALKDQLHVTVPADAYWAMDYHLDWLYASLVLAADGEEESRRMLDGRIKAQQEDVDLIVAWEDGNWTNLILAEAKGVTGFTNEQMGSKAARLTEIFEQRLVERARVRPYFCLISPYQTKRLKSDDWPGWMKRDGRATIVPLPITGPLKKVTRCDEGGHKTGTGHRWKVEPLRVHGSR